MGNYADKALRDITAELISRITQMEKFDQINQMEKFSKVFKSFIKLTNKI